MTRVAPAPPATRAAGGLGARWRHLPWWGRALVVFAASRVVTTLLFLWVGTQATTASRAGAHPSLVDLGVAWDGEWYRIVSVFGYPATLPLAANGSVDTNAWAFLPVWPYLVKLLSFGQVAAWAPVAIVLATLCGFAAAVLLGLLLRPHIGEERAGFAVAVFAFSPLSFVLQTAYAESLGLVLLLGALCLADRGRYLAAIPVAVALAFTRPESLALALAVGVQLGIRLVGAARGGVAVPPRETRGAAALVAVSIVAGFAWPVIAAAGTGVPDAYFQTEQAWRALWMPGTDFAYFTPWLFAADFWFGPVAGPVVLAVLVVGFALTLFARPVRRLGVLVRLWCAAYGLYLLAVFFPQSSVFRLLMPMAPLAGAVVPRSPPLRIGLLAASVALQGLWLWCTYGPFQAYWSVP
ncbi:MAG: hypothetical protein QOE37_1354 [Microbacteriaceae bacterium]|nr:hypothetical protein [Microbacteriaceae bacterium]